MRSLLILAILFAATPVMLYIPHIGVLAWTWISYMNPHRLTWGAAFSFPVAEVIAIPTLVGWFITKERKEIPSHPLIYLILLYVLWVTATSIHGYNQDMIWDKWEKFLKIILFTIMTAAIMRTQTRLHALIWVIVLSVGYFAWKGGLFTLLTAGAFTVWGPVGSFFFDNNQMGTTALMLLPLIRYLQLQTKTKLAWWAMMGAIGLNLLCIFGTQSRGALVGMVAVLGYMMIRSGQFVAIAIGVLALGFGFLFMPNDYRERIASIADYENDNSAQGRFRMWSFAIDVANESPIMGGGFDVFYHFPTREKFISYNYEREFKVGRAAHSIYFEVLGEHGYVGLLIFLSIGIATFFNAGRIRREIKGRGDLKWCTDLASMIQLSLIAYATSGAFLTLATFDLFWHLVAIMALTHLIARDKLKEPPGAEVSADPIFSHVIGLITKKKRPYKTGQTA